MASLRNSKLFPCLLLILIATMSSPASASASAQLSTSFYANTCPSVFDAVRSAVQSAINRNPRAGATLSRLFFHDCFVNGCDASILLDDTGSFVGEKTALPNGNLESAFTAIDQIKTQVDSACGQFVVSCADIVAIAARDSIVELGGPSYSVPVGRRDARTASLDRTSDIPTFNNNLDDLIRNFGNKGFSAREMVALSGAHTIGQATCVTFRDRIYNQANIDPAFATMRQDNCPRQAPNGDSNAAPLDPQSPNRFGNNYFQALMNRRGLLNSDQVLFNGGSTDSIVSLYSSNANAFSTDFANAMAKMANLSPLTGTEGEVRLNCRRVN